MNEKDRRMTLFQIQDPVQVQEDIKKVGRIACLPLSAYDEKICRSILTQIHQSRPGHTLCTSDSVFIVTRMAFLPEVLLASLKKGGIANADSRKSQPLDQAGSTCRGQDWTKDSSPT